MKSRKFEVWKSPELAEKYLNGVRGGIPFAKEEIEIMLKLIEISGNKVKEFLDFGCGDGVLAASILQKYPKSRGVLLDFSEPMIKAAMDKLAGSSTNLDFVTFDYSDSHLVGKVSGKGPFDVVVSGFSIHHQPDRRKEEIYFEIYDLLNPGGMFLNLEHVLPHSPFVREVFDEVFAGSLYNLHVRQGGKRTRAEIAREFRDRPDKEANIIAPVEKQCDWLRKIGYKDVDCYFKILELAIFGGRKP